LNKKKLDELVRQVTGGGEGMGGETLTPEVEEVLHTITYLYFTIAIC
jgi:transcription initiation factor TFIID subunit 12